MQTISDDYREQNSELHSQREDYGTSGSRWAGLVDNISDDVGCETVLDYGAGKQTLAKSLPTLNITSYDPAIEKISEKPEGKFDMVVCTDVMEHVEPEYLDNVLDDLRRYTGKIIFMNIATRPAVKSLPDGRNAHLVVEDYRWWWPKLIERFDCVQFSNMGGKEFNFVGEPRRLD